MLQTVIDFEKKKMFPLTKRAKITSNCDRMCGKRRNICGKRFLKKFANGKNYGKVRDHCHFTDKFRGTLYSICN